MQRRWEMTDAELKTAGSFVNTLTQLRHRALCNRALHSRGQ
jgi:hypothetical protein